MYFLSQILLLTLLLSFTFCKMEKFSLFGNDTSEADFNWSKNKNILPSPSKEMKFKNLFSEADAAHKFEGSGVFVKDQYFYVVFDNTTVIGKIHEDLTPAGSLHQLIGTWGEKSNYEGITSKEGEKSPFYAVVESVEYEKDSYRPELAEFDYQLNLLKKKPINFLLAKKNKGIEGITHIKRSGQDYLLALCEGNYCTSDKEKTKGNGRIQVIKEKEDFWEKIAEIKIPPFVDFLDYSDIDIENNRVIIVSQSSSALWIGELLLDEWKFADNGKKYYFPHGNKKGEIGKGPETIYCNIEGVSWISPRQVVVVSDKAGSDQDKWCAYKEQMIHIFDIPE